MTLMVLVVFAAACGGAERDASGDIVAAGDESAFDLRIGDCFDDPSNFAEVASVPALPCSEPHDNEVFAKVNMTNATYPGDGSVDDFAMPACYDAFEAYTGESYEASALDFGYLGPSAESWEQIDDREVICLLYDVDFSKLSSSMRAPAS